MLDSEDIHPNRDSPQLILRKRRVKIKENFRARRNDYKAVQRNFEQRVYASTPSSPFDNTYSKSSWAKEFQGQFSKKERRK